MLLYLCVCSYSMQKGKQKFYPCTPKNAYISETRTTPANKCVHESVCMPFWYVHIRARARAFARIHIHIKQASKRANKQTSNHLPLYFVISLHLHDYLRWAKRCTQRTHYDTVKGVFYYCYLVSFFFFFFSNFTHYFRLYFSFAMSPLLLSLSLSLSSSSFP